MNEVEPIVNALASSLVVFIRIPKDPQTEGPLRKWAWIAILLIWIMKVVGLLGLTAAFLQATAISQREVWLCAVAALVGMVFGLYVWPKWILRRKDA